MSIYFNLVHHGFSSVFPTLSSCTGHANLNYKDSFITANPQDLLNPRKVALVTWQAHILSTTIIMVPRASIVPDSIAPCVDATVSAMEMKYRALSAVFPYDMDSIHVSGAPRLLNIYINPFHSKSQELFDPKHKLVSPYT